MIISTCSNWLRLDVTCWHLLSSSGWRNRRRWAAKRLAGAEICLGCVDLPGPSQSLILRCFRMFQLSPNPSSDRFVAFIVRCPKASMFPHRHTAAAFTDLLFIRKMRLYVLQLPADRQNGLWAEEEIIRKRPSNHKTGAETPLSCVFVSCVFHCRTRDLLFVFHL